MDLSFSKADLGVMVSKIFVGFLLTSDPYGNDPI